MAAGLWVSVNQEIVKDYLLTSGQQGENEWRQRSTTSQGRGIDVGVSMEPHVQVVAGDSCITSGVLTWHKGQIMIVTALWY